MTARLLQLIVGGALILAAPFPALAQKLMIGGAGTLPDARVGVDYSTSLLATGGQQPYLWAVTSGSLPAGLSLSLLTGAISGRPTAAGSSTFRVTVTDVLLQSDNKNFSITTLPGIPPTISTTSLANGVVGTVYAQSLAATGGSTPYIWSAAVGTLPSGLTLAANGTISGTPTATGIFNFTVSVTDAVNLSSTKGLQITVSPAPVAPTITTASLSGGTVGTAYSQSLAATGGSAPYVWSLDVGTLPGGLSLAANGTISGTPSAPGTSNFTVKVTGAGNASSTKGLQIIVSPAPVPPTITTTSLSGGTVGTAYSQPLTATGGTAPYAWSLDTGTLPAGLTVASNGTISGTPTASGTSNFTVKVTDAANLSSTKALQIIVSPAPVPPTITTASLSGGTVGTTYSQFLTGTGGTSPYVWSLDVGTLPGGLSLAANGTISGIPTASGTSNFTVKVTDAVNLSSTKGFQIIVSPAPVPPTISTASLSGGTVGTAYSQSLTGTGGTSPYVWSLDSGTLPAGLTVAGNGTISGIPTASGTSNFTVKVTDAVNLSSTKGLQIIVSPAPVPPTIITASLSGGTVGTAYSQSLTAAGGTAPYVWSLDAGTLPAGLALGSNGSISGTPTASGTSNFSVKVTDAVNLSSSKQLQITIAAAPLPPSITTTSLNGGTVGTAYAQTLAAFGGATPYSWSISAGSLPAGLNLAASGSISGTPTTAGIFDFTAKVTDSLNLSSTKTFQITIGAAPLPPAITTSSLAAGTAGTAYSQSLTANGGTAPYVWSISAGTLPAGLTLAANGAISGTPTAAGSFSFTAKLTDAANLSSTRAFAITISPAPVPPAITTGALAGATAGTPYAQTLGASGGTPPYSWSVATGSLPVGLTLISNGLISGTPTAAGTFEFAARVMDAANLTATKALQIVTTAPPAALSVTTQALANGTVQTAYSQSLTATGGTAPYTWSISAGNLPGGLALSSNGTISGTPTTAGVFSFTATANDATSTSATKTFGITIGAAAAPPAISTTALSGGVTGTAYSQSLVATAGTPPYIWSVVGGSLPPGLSLASNGLLSGTPSIAGGYDFTVKVTDASNLSDSKALRVTITAAVSPLSVTSTSLPGGPSGTPYAATVTAAGGQGPYSWSVSSGGLPPGVSLQTSTGQLSGTPTAAGTYVFSLRITDAGGRTAERSLTIQIVQGLVIFACPATEGFTGTSYSSTVSATGGTTPYTWSILGQLPPGLALNSSSGILSGTPLVPGTSSYTLQVTDTGGLNASRSCSILVSVPLTMITQNLPDAATQTNYSQFLAATGGTAPYRWSTSAGSLPPGIALNEATGGLSGAPTQSGRFTFTVVLSDAVGKQVQRTFTINVAAGLTIPACPFPTASVSQRYSSTLAAIGGLAPYSWSLTAGALPAGLTISPDSGLISGAPTASGTPLFTVQVRDSSGVLATRQCSISAAPQLVITTAALASGSTGSPYSDTVSMTGGTVPYTLTISAGALPPGLALNAATGAISGLPTQTGTFPVTVRVLDSAGISAEKQLSLTITAGFSISSCPIPAATVAVTYSSGLSLSGGGLSVTWSLSAGALPPGLSLDSGTGSVAGTPTNAGRFDFTVTASNGTASPPVRACSISVSAPGLTITTAPAFPSGVMGLSYDQTLAAAGGRAPYTWTVATGPLPPGLELGESGRLAGTPTAPGTFPFTLRVTDRDTASATQQFTLRVLPAAAPAISFEGLPDIVGAAQQPKVSFAFDKGYPVSLKGKLMLQFTPDPSVGVDDKSISFVTGGRVVDFEVPANATQPNFPVPQLALQTGTVAGTISLGLQLTAGDIDITPPAAQKTIRIDRTAPVISSVKINSIANGFEVAVTGYSTTREVSTATFSFTPATGSRLVAADVVISTADVARSWFRDPRSNDFGSQFTFIQPFTVQGATLSEVSVTLTNGQGTSQAVRARF